MEVKVPQSTSPICGNFSETKKNLTKSSATIEIGTLTLSLSTLCMVVSLSKFSLKLGSPNTSNGSVNYFSCSNWWNLRPTVQIGWVFLKRRNEDLQSTSYSQRSTSFWFDGSFGEKTLPKIPWSHAKLRVRQPKNLRRNQNW